MERHERTARDRHRRRHAGHHVMIAAAVIRVLVANRADDRELVGHARKLGNALAKMDTGNLRGNGFKLAANLGRRVRLGIERFVMRRATILPNEDAIDVLPANSRRQLRTGLSTIRPQPQQITEAEAEHAAQAKLDEIPASYSVAIGVYAEHSLMIKHKLKRIHQTPGQILGSFATGGFGRARGVEIFDGHLAFVVGADPAAAAISVPVPSQRFAGNERALSAAVKAAAAVATGLFSQAA